MKALVLWADRHSTNLGVQALASGTSQMLQRITPGAAIDFQSYGPGPAPVPLSLRSICRSMSGVDTRLTAWLQGYDVVIDTSAGDSFTDIYGKRRLLEMSLTRALAVRAGVPTVLGPQTIGPFGTPLTRGFARWSLSGVDSIMARDSASLRSLSKSLACSGDLATDVVFAIPLQQACRQGPDVLFNVSGLLWQQNTHIDNEMYRKACVRYCESLLARGMTVEIFPHVLASSHPDNDVTAAADLSARLNGLAITTPTGLDDARGHIASSRLVVGARMHACLNALSLGIPTIPWSYSLKFKPLLADLGWAHEVDLRQTDPTDYTRQCDELLLSTGPDLLAPVLDIAQAGLSSYEDRLRSIIE
ncbi:polysaccharide pyruvyl transferase family protein [Pseudonocardia sp. RS010]|uniref:polysaccharide pyruvyl transferase family protein n=1 Tax=Pseudonocardia sp. RS010 TaxID=3385979 RepID=UPI0039A1CF1F